MYYYIFDAPRGPQDYQRIAQIKEQLTQLGIAGEMSSPMPGKEVPELVQNALSKRYSTIVVVGDSNLINQVATAVVGHDVALGIISLHDNDDIIQLTGMHSIEHACEQLKKRRWHSVWLGEIEGNGCFLTPARIDLPNQQPLELVTTNFKLKARGVQLSISPQQGDTTSRLAIEFIHNPVETQKPGFLGGLFGAKTVIHYPTRFQTDQLTVNSQEPLPVVVAGNVIYQTPTSFTAANKPIRLIVARHGNPSA